MKMKPSERIYELADEVSGKRLGIHGNAELYIIATLKYLDEQAAWEAKGPELVPQDVDSLAGVVSIDDPEDGTLLLRYADGQQVLAKWTPKLHVDLQRSIDRGFKVGGTTKGKP